MSLIKFELKKEPITGGKYPISFKIIEQSGLLYNKRYDIDFVFSTFTIWSSVNPQLSLDDGKIFIRGSDNTGDNKKCFEYFNSEKKRDAVYDLIILAFKRLKDYVD